MEQKGNELVGQRTFSRRKRFTQRYIEINRNKRPQPTTDWGSPISSDKWRSVLFQFSFERGHSRQSAFATCARSMYCSATDQPWRSLDRFSGFCGDSPTLRLIKDPSNPCFALIMFADDIDVSKRRLWVTMGGQWILVPRKVASQ